MKEKKGLKQRIAESGPAVFITESIQRKLLFWILVLLGVFMVLQSFIAIQIGYDLVTDDTEKQLLSLQRAKKEAIETYFQERRTDMQVLRETVNALRSETFRKLSTMQLLKKRFVENYFAERIYDINVLSRTPVISESIRAFSQFSGRVGGPAWQKVDAVYGPFLTQYSDAFAYFDLYLVSPEGEVLYTAAKETDLGQNLMTGHLKDSPLAKAFTKGMKGVSFQDYEHYTPAGGLPASFISAPVSPKGTLLGVVIVQMPTDQIDLIMQDRTGLGESGESFLVGKDHLFRSNSALLTENTLLNPSYTVETKDVDRALSGETGQGIMINHKDKYVLSTWTPVRILDVTWALIVQEDVEEALIPREKGEKADFFTRFKQVYGYRDIGLVNPDGFYFYTATQGKDYNTNLKTGIYRNTNLGKLVQSVLEKKEWGMADFSEYPAADNQKSGFFALPVLSPDDNSLQMVITARFTSREISRVMEEKGLGETGETYLVGQDRLFRSASRFEQALGVESTVMNPGVKADTKAVENAFHGDPGMGEYPDYRDEPVLTAWSQITVFPPTEVNPDGIQYALIGQMDKSEVRKPVWTMILWAVTVHVIGFIVGFIVVWYLSRGLTRQVTLIQEMMSEIGMGNFEARAPVVTNDEIGEMAESLNSMLDNTLALIQSTEERDAMQKAVMRLLDEISDLAEGDLRIRAEVTEDFTGAIADSFNHMAEQLGQVVKTVKSVTRQVSATSKDVRDSTENLAETSQKQARQVADAISAIKEMAASIQQVAENAAKSSEVSEQSMAYTKDGANAVLETNRAMESIREHVQETARAIKRLGESSQEVGNIVQLINDIADRTSILALNASIQAAMAGEAGRGFAVVAEEVQRLAERSTNATQQIDTLIKNIQGEINEAGTSMEESIERVVEGSRLADNAHTKLSDIESITIQLGELIHSISTASNQQAKASENIAKTMEDVGEISSQTKAASQQTAEAMKNLAETSDHLNQEVSVFRLEEDESDS